MVVVALSVSYACYLQPTHCLAPSPIASLHAAAKDAVFFQHGVMDTACGWVANGTHASQAFAAFDQGFDVWLGTTRR